MKTDHSFKQSFLEALLQATFLFAFFLFSTGDLHAAEGIALNDTGVDWCGSDKAIRLDCPQSGFPGQDAEVGRDALARSGKLAKAGAGHAGFDFTKVDASGKGRPVDAKQWHCVRDNHTGLLWEVKTDDNPVALRHKDHNYSWYDPGREKLIGKGGHANEGICSGSQCDTHAYVQAVNAKGLCGHKDWRLPTMTELRSIVDYGKRWPVIDTDYFPNTAAKMYWTAEPWPIKPNTAWAIFFKSGKGSFRQTDEADVAIRLVRGNRLR